MKTRNTKQINFEKKIKKTILTFGLSVFLFSGINTPVQAEACTTTVNKVCDFIFPKDGTVETEENYSTCQSIGQGWCKDGRDQNVKVESLRQAVEERPKKIGSYINSKFELDVSCEEGTSQIGLVDLNTNSYLSIASINNKGVVADNIAKLLSSETRSWIGKRIMDDESSDSDAIQPEIASCLDIKAPDTRTEEGVSVCYPDEDTNCAIWEWICVEVLDGELGHNICTW